MLWNCVSCPWIWRKKADFLQKLVPKTEESRSTDLEATRPASLRRIFLHVNQCAAALLILHWGRAPVITSSLYVGACFILTCYIALRCSQSTCMVSCSIHCCSTFYWLFFFFSWWAVADLETIEKSLLVAMASKNLGEACLDANKSLPIDTACLSVVNQQDHVVTLLSVFDDCFAVSSFYDTYSALWSSALFNIVHCLCIETTQCLDDAFFWIRKFNNFVDICYHIYSL